MPKINNILENTRKEVELYGASGAESVFLTNLRLEFKSKDLDCPEDADLRGAITDFDWFVLCEKAGCVVPHPSPDESFWIKFFGEQALPYGQAWNFKALKDTLQNPAKHRRGVLYNPRSYDSPPCILTYQFHVERYSTLDVTVTMRSSDVAKVLSQDVLMSWLLLCHVAKLVGLEPGDMVFNIANAHIYWEDTEFQEEFTFDDGL